MFNLLAIALFKPFNDKLSEGKGRNCDEYPSLNTEETNVELWWNSLSSDEQHKVGDVAIHFNIMTARCQWNCYYQSDHRNRWYNNIYEGCTWQECSKSQQKRIKFVFDKRFEKYSMFYLPGFIK